MKCLSVLGVTCAVTLCSLVSAQTTKETSVLSSLEAKHPRLMLKEVDLGREADLGAGILQTGSQDGFSALVATCPEDDNHAPLPLLLR